MSENQMPNLKPTTLMVSTLIAGAIAGAAPQIPTLIKGAFAPGSIATAGAVDERGGTGLQIGWPSTPKPVVLRHRGKTYSAYLPLRNSSTQPQCVRIDAHVQSSEGTDSGATIVVPDRSFMVMPSEAVVQPVEIALKTLNPDGVTGPASGFLRISYADSAGLTNPNTCTLSGTPKAADLEIRVPEQPLMGCIFLGTLVTTALVVVVTAISLLATGKSLFDVMGGVNWSFERSWGANVTLGSALLMTLLGLTMFPERPYLMTKASYSLLQILFGALVSMAPLAYNLIRREVQVNKIGTPQVEVQGYVITFLLAGALVLWAAIGQVVTLSAVAEELIFVGVLDRRAGRTLQGLGGLLFVLLLIYGIRSLYLTAKTVSAGPTAFGGSMPGPQPAPAAAVATLPAPMTEWSVL